jgi:hypothetical protein
MKEIIKVIKRIDSNTVLTLNNHKEIALYATHFNGITLGNICIWKRKFSDMPLENILKTTIVTVLYNNDLFDKAFIYIGGKDFTEIIFQARYKFENDLVSEASYTNENDNKCLLLTHFLKDNMIMSTKYSEDDPSAARCRSLVYDPEKKEVIRVTKED